MAEFLLGSQKSVGGKGKYLLIYLSFLGKRAANEPWISVERLKVSICLGAEREDGTQTPPPPSAVSPDSGFTAPEGFPPPSQGVSQADAIPYLTTAPSASPEPLTALSSLKPVSSQESKALGSHSTATAMVISTTPAGDSSISQHCK